RPAPPQVVGNGMRRRLLRFRRGEVVNPAVVLPQEAGSDHGVARSLTIADRDVEAAPKGSQVSIHSCRLVRVLLNMPPWCPLRVPALHQGLLFLIHVLAGYRS